MGLVRHLSVRVPWHDRAWDGHVCDAPLENSSCLALKLVAENRRDEVEEVIAGEAFDKLPREQLPPCLRASASFLSPHSQAFDSVMAYSKWSKDHAHILPRTMHFPAWGALVIPYRWMLKESGFEIAKALELDADPDREPTDPPWLERTSWIQGFSNQQTLLDTFAEPLAEEESLVLFYATRTPLCDDERRVLLGAALLRKKHDLTEYPYDKAKNADLRAMVWERPVQHSLRPKGNAEGFNDGFVMPYHTVLEELERRPELVANDYVAFVPDDARIQFSYGSEQVTHGVAASALLAARGALERTAAILEGPWERYISWIDERLSRLWKLQGPAPGLGVVLSSLHRGFNGTLFAIALSDVLEENADPWPVIDSILSGDREPPEGSPLVTSMLRRHWERVKKKPPQLDRLKLLARMELTKNQADRALEFDENEVLANPYRLFEEDRTEVEPISFGVVDRGLYPGKEVASAHPLPDACNPDLQEYDNAHRLRAACVEILEQSTADGHTLLPVDEVAEATRDLSAVHDIPLDADMVDICRDEFESVISVIGNEKDMMVQLGRYVQSGKLLQSAVDERLKNLPKATKVNWRKLVDEKFGEMKEGDTDEDRARAEKVTALERLARSRIAVLIGPAGTGKTSVLQLLLGQEKIVGPRVRLLAPTGKARVRLGQETKREGEVQTVAQFLLGLERYDTPTGRYFTNSEAAKKEATTCVVDESSMLTEDMLAAVVDALPENCRLILVGDPYQLPPIGAGCPFVDIIEYLQREQSGTGVGELTTPRRQGGEGDGKSGGNNRALARADVQLAAIFSGRPLPPGEDEIVVNAIEGLDDDTVKYRQWEHAADLATLIDKVLAEELESEEQDLVPAFEASLGAEKNSKGYLVFDRGSSHRVDQWQILSVNRNGPGGSVFLNRGIKERLRSERLKQAVESNNKPHYQEWMRFTKPRGPEQIVYGDKVICVRNHRRTPWLYKDKAKGRREFLANGEIGVVTGQRTWGKRNPNFTHVELSGRGDRNFSFTRSSFSEDGQPFLELAYALTVHKAQGSEFGSVMLVLPSHSRLVSREMLYTALTRQKRRIWILHQGPFDRFLALRQYAFSDIGARFTNLLRTPARKKARIPAEIPAGFSGSKRGFLEERLMHRTIRGEMVSSKNELVIANILFGLEKEGHLTHEVEPKLPFDDGRGRWADFKVEAGGQTWYWEHCGMLDDEHYRNRWEKKKKLYAENGFTIHSDKNASGRLIVTVDGPNQGLDAKAIEKLAQDLFVG
ncbi:MAG: AAA family ATPase [Chloroflexi bacterium]|nr:AAA family ATPase [Chloroflexota bacterium]